MTVDLKKLFVKLILVKINFIFNMTAMKCHSTKCHFDHMSQLQKSVMIARYYKILFLLIKKTRYL
jgi:hypothetical protein